VSECLGDGLIVDIDADPLQKGLGGLDIAVVLEDSASDRVP